MVGDSGVGKSCLLEKLLDSASNNHFISTIGVDVKTHSVTHNGETYKLQVRGLFCLIFICGGGKE